MSTIAERREYQREIREALALDAAELARTGSALTPAPLLDTRICRQCGCSDSLACPDGCWWVEADLCSECAADLDGAQR
jgi:hypothetical protein